jgi:Ni/Fe-hydrogenase 1 B-type cytochrome subunit
MRIRAKALPADGYCLVHEYVWEWPVRITHWLNAISIWVLSVTGIYIGYPMLLASGPASDHFLMGWAKLIHFYAAIVFALSVLSRIAWMFMGNKYANWDKFLPVRKKRYEGLLPTLKYYFFVLRMPPGFVGHNPLAGLTYAFLFVGFLIQILTGLAMYAASAHVDSPVQAFAFLIPVFGGLQTARFIHHIIMWLIWCFFVHHVYSAIVMSQVEGHGTIESIFSGWKFPFRDDLIYSGYRLFKRPKRRHE